MPLNKEKKTKEKNWKKTPNKQDYINNATLDCYDDWGSCGVNIHKPSVFKSKSS